MRRKWLAPAGVMVVGLLAAGALLGVALTVFFPSSKVEPSRPALSNGEAIAFVKRVEGLRTGEWSAAWVEGVWVIRRYYLVDSYQAQVYLSPDEWCPEHINRPVLPGLPPYQVFYDADGQERYRNVTDGRCWKWVERPASLASSCWRLWEKTQTVERIGVGSPPC